LWAMSSVGFSALFLGQVCGPGPTQVHE